MRLFAHHGTPIHNSHLMGWHYIRYPAIDDCIAIKIIKIFETEWGHNPSGQLACAIKKKKYRKKESTAATTFSM